MGGNPNASYFVNSYTNTNPGHAKRC